MRKGIRLLLVNRGLPTTRVFKEAVPAVEGELIALENPEEALRRIRDEKFDGIFIDPTLPHLDRQSLTHLVRNSKFNSQAPLVFLTSYRGNGPGWGKETEGVSLMVKPSRPADLQPFLKELRRKLLAERRQHRRLPFRTSVNGLGGARRFRATSINLSATGMLLEVSLRFERGEEFEVHFLLATEDPTFHARARVMRIDGPNRLGVSFQNLGSAERQRLRRFLDIHLPPR